MPNRDTFHPLFYEKLAVGTAPVALASVPVGAGPSGAAFAQIRIEDAPARYLDTGATPNASTGQLLKTDESIWYDGGPFGLSQFRAAAQATPTGMLHVTYYS